MVIDYTTEQFNFDITTYIEHVEKTFRRLKLVGIVPKDYAEHADPLLHDMFVPMHVMVSPRRLVDDERLVISEKPGLLIDMLKSHLDPEHRYAVLLGGPGTGKSTIVRQLVWSHVAAHKDSQAETDVSLLSDNPVPLRIELRHFAEQRHHFPSCDFLSYASDVMHREGIKLNGPLFQHLLTQKRLLLLLDGLDEVATLAERKGLVSEIEAFVNSEPGRGNYVIVTSRPIGYDLAPLSREQFLHAEIQLFGDRQIRQFLENWYNHFLKLSPIPSSDLQELEALYKALKDNPRLHGLAENPLLLTVITALHRYERLPDRRVLVYDRCADLLLENWARLKGTLQRWQDMRMGKEDQYACVGHLGYTLHVRSQEQVSKRNTASDVPESFLLQTISEFIKGQHLVVSEMEQHREAELFFGLIRTEAGLIVEHGTGENEEVIYGFIHRTFQEYFAAAHIYNQYLQEESPQHISQFLKEHLHDPHWREVIFLLLGKLLRKPVTNQLTGILRGSIISLRSRNTDLVQQDLFFVCDCLTEGITAESGLLDQVLERLSDMIQNSPFPSQQTEAMQAFDALIRTRQYAGPALKTLEMLVTQHCISDKEIQELAARTLYNNSQSQPEVHLLAANTLLKLAQEPAFPLEKAIGILGDLYGNDRAEMQEVRQEAARLLLQLAIRSGNEPSLYEGLMWDFLGARTKSISEHMQLILELIQRPDISIQSIAHIISSLEGYRMEMRGYLSRDARSSFAIEDGIRLGTQRLLTLVKQPTLSIDERLRVSQIILQPYSPASPNSLLALQLLEHLAQQPNLSVEQSLQIAETILKLIDRNPQTLVHSFDMLKQLLQQTDLSTEQLLCVAEVLYRKDSQERQHTSDLLLQLILQADLSDEQMKHIFKLLYDQKYLETEQITQKLLGLIRQSNCSAEKIAQIFRMSNGYIDKTLKEYHEIAQLCLNRAQQTKIGFEELLDIITSLAKHSHESDPAIHQQAIQILLELAQKENLSMEEMLQVGQVFYYSALYKSPFHKDAIYMLRELAERTVASIEQIIQIAQILLGSETSYSSTDGITIARKRASFREPLKQEEEIAGEQILRWLLQHRELSFTQMLQVAALLFYEEKQNRQNSEQNIQFLWQTIQDQRFTPEEQAQFAVIPLMVAKSTYEERARAVQVVLALLKKEEARQLFERYWKRAFGRNSISATEFPYIVELAKQKLLPIKVRDELYQLLQQLVPEFDKI